jgi:amino acid transporter
LFFKVFKEMDPVKKLPIKGSWLSVIPVCFCAFFMDLTQLAKLCSLCNLMTYSFIDAAVVALRLKNVNSQEEINEEVMNDSDAY